MGCGAINGGGTMGCGAFNAGGTMGCGAISGGGAMTAPGLDLDLHGAQEQNRNPAKIGLVCDKIVWEDHSEIPGPWARACLGEGGSFPLVRADTGTGTELEPEPLEASIRNCHLNQDLTFLEDIATRQTYRGHALFLGGTAMKVAELEPSICENIAREDLSTCTQACPLLTLSSTTWDLLRVAFGRPVQSISCKQHVLEADSMMYRCCSVWRLGCVPGSLGRWQVAPTLLFTNGSFTWSHHGEFVGTFLRYLPLDPDLRDFRLVERAVCFFESA